jgi:hypothetical protein
VDLWLRLGYLAIYAYANLAGTGVPAGTKYPRIAGAGVISCPWRVAGAGAGVSSRWRARA